MKQMRWIGVVVAAVLVGCRPATEERPRPAPMAKPAPGEEPLETASIGDEDVQTLAAERGEGGAAAADPSPLGACSWSSVWQKDDVPNPRLAGVDGLPMPVRTSGKDVLIPGDRPADFAETAEIHAEIVIGPFGAVLEATIVHAPEPRWPEAEQAILDAVRGWRYEPQTLRGEPISVCSTLVMKP